MTNVHVGRFDEQLRAYFRYDFFDRLGAIIVPHENVVVILDPKCPCVVKDKRENGVNILSAIKLSKGVDKKEPTFLASVKVDEGWVSRDETPRQVIYVL